MAEATHTFDPQGEVIIVLKCISHPFAPYGGQKRKRRSEKREVARKKKKVHEASNARGWKEGTSLLEMGSVEITADGWDLEAFLILMNIFHARPQKVPKVVNLKLLAKVTVLADYYECQESVQYFALKWFKLPDDEFFPSDHRDLMLTIWIAWVSNYRPRSKS
ncbi:uncharacterized protein KD926_002665 [Aspergillus affinis]|uniref:uncharacterized protein n=1 Tax=Aspergillus affinis TaxID=1070780 RepID=UPI0022FEDAF5|nr:uncharacterized protein KD926_002665 [Aspergillus affinis]KAI9043775.1 hypothetical protein KD926_002665 [Aspergillus affinis]